MRKKMDLIFVVFGLLFGFTACAPKTSKPTAAETASVAEMKEEKEETKTETAASKPKESKEETKETKESKETKEETSEEIKTELQSVTGQVVEINKTVITISGQDNLEYQVEVKNAETKSDLEIGEGDVIQVLFLEQEEEIKTARSYDILSSVALEGDSDPVIAGIVQQVDAGTVTIEAASGKTYRFSTAIAQIVKGKKGIVAGEYAEITYLGSLLDGKALRVVMEDGSGDAEAMYNTLSGKLVSLDTSLLVLETADGSRFSFALGEFIDPEELTAGENVILFYEGSLTKQNAVATDVESQ